MGLVSATFLAALLCGSLPDELGFAEGAGLAGAAVAAPSDGAAAFYNPSRAASLADPAFSLGLLMGQPHLRLGDRGARMTPPRAVGFALGVPALTTPVGRFGVSLGFLTPTRWLLRATVRPNDAPRLLGLDNRLERLSVDVAISWTETIAGIDWSAAAGLTLLGGASGADTLNELRLRGSRAEATARLNADLPLVVAPLAVLGGQLDAWHLALTYRGAIAFDFAFATTTVIDVDGIIVDGYAALLAPDFYTPERWQLGASYVGALVTLHGAVAWHRWSAAPPLAGKALLDVSLDGAEQPVPESIAIDEVLADVWGVHLGAEAGVDWGESRLLVRLGAAYETSMIPEPQAEALFLDAPRLRLAAGLSLRSPETFAVFLRPGEVSAHVALTELLPTRFGALRVRGSLWSWGLSVTQRF